METLRQIALSKNEKTLDRNGTVVLAAPDVDTDVSRTQVSQIGPLRSRNQIYVSSDDRALKISRRFFGGKMGAGENTDLAQFQELGIAAHDISIVKGELARTTTRLSATVLPSPASGRCLRPAPSEIPF